VHIGFVFEIHVPTEELFLSKAQACSKADGLPVSAIGMSKDLE
jgi:hypothetical protein